MIRIERGDGLGISTCRACGARIVWALTDRGKRAPIDREPSPRGNMVLHYDTGGDDAGKPRVTALAFWEHQTGKPVPPSERRLNHFATCPEADRFSGEKPPVNDPQMDLFGRGGRS